MEKRPQEAIGKCFAPVVIDELTDGVAHLRVVEGDDDFPEGVDALVDLDDVLAADDVGWRHLGLQVGVVGAG